MTAIEQITDAELLEYSQNFSVVRPQYPGNRLFPDEKTRSLKAKFYQISDGAGLPVMASVHALNTEAEIGSRPAFDKVELEKMLIKRKIDLNEREALYLDQGSSDAGEIIDFIYDDIGRMAESVVTRAEVMKQELIATGKVTAAENHLNLTMDYQIPAEQTEFSFDWTGEDADVLGDIQTVADMAADNGQILTGMELSQKQLSNILKNKSVQKAIFGAIGEGVLVPRERLQSLLGQLYGFTEIIVNDLKYGVEDKSGKITAHRFYPDNRATFFSAPGGRLGAGLWGVTREETQQGPWTDRSAQQYVTVVKYAEPDPPTTWTKAAGLFVPALFNRRSLFIAALAGGSAGTLPARSRKA